MAGYYHRTQTAIYTAYGYLGGRKSSKLPSLICLNDFDKELLDIATRQVEWITGFNPFAMNTIYGDGYDYPLLYGAYAGNLVGSVPIGIETFENIDEPYFPMQSNCTYKEIWTHSTARMIDCVAEMFKYK